MHVHNGLSRAPLSHPPMGHCLLHHLPPVLMRPTLHELVYVVCLRSAALRPSTCVVFLFVAFRHCSSVMNKRKPGSYSSHSGSWSSQGCVQSKLESRSQVRSLAARRGALRLGAAIFTFVSGEKSPPFENSVAARVWCKQARTSTAL